MASRSPLLLEADQQVRAAGRRRGGELARGVRIEHLPPVEHPVHGQGRVEPRKAARVGGRVGGAEFGGQRLRLACLP